MQYLYTFLQEFMYFMLIVSIISWVKPLYFINDCLELVDIWRTTANEM